MYDDAANAELSHSHPVSDAPLLFADLGVRHRQHDLATVCVHLLWASEAALHLRHWVAHCCREPAAVWNFWHASQSSAQVKLNAMPATALEIEVHSCACSSSCDRLQNAASNLFVGICTRFLRAGVAFVLLVR